MVANVCETLGQNSGTRDKRGGDPDVSAAYSEHRFRARLGRLHDVQIRRDGDRARDRKKAFRTDGREYRRKRVGPSKDPIWAISERNLKSAGGHPPRGRQRTQRRNGLPAARIRWNTREYGRKRPRGFRMTRQAKCGRPTRRSSNASRSSPGTATLRRTAAKNGEWPRTGDVSALPSNRRTCSGVCRKGRDARFAAPLRVRNRRVPPDAGSRRCVRRS